MYMCMEESFDADVDHEEEEDWDVGFSASSKQTPLQPPSEHRNDCHESEEEDYGDGDEEDNYNYDEYDENKYHGDNEKADLGCPYCIENFDILGLCCHIDDQHYEEAKSMICPLCDKNLSTNMTVHIIGQHESILRALRRKKLRRDATKLNLSQSTKEEHIHSQLKASSHMDSSPDLSPDPLLLSFVQNPRPACKPETVQAASPCETALSWKKSNDETEERSIELSSVADKLQEKGLVSEFVHELLFSKIFVD